MTSFVEELKAATSETLEAQKLAAVVDSRKEHDRKMRLKDELKIKFTNKYHGEWRPKIMAAAKQGKSNHTEVVGTHDTRREEEELEFAGPIIREIIEQDGLKVDFHTERVKYSDDDKGSNETSIVISW